METEYSKTLCCRQRENRLRGSLGIFITLHKAGAVYLWRLEMKQKFSQILLLEILYVLHTTYSRNNMCQKCGGDCGLWVLHEIILKTYPENLKKNCGSRLGVTC